MSQLIMEKRDLWNTPVVEMPAGYTLRTYRPGDEAGLGRIYAACELGEGSPEYVRGRMIAHPCFKPERIFIVLDGEEAVGTAAAWVEDGDPGVGYLHMVGTLPEYRGKGLGKLLTVAAIRFTHHEGLPAQRLKTDDWRESALRMYLALGYDPLLLDESHPGRWQVLAQKLDMPQIITRARSIPSAAGGFSGDKTVIA
jgi:mycothiol synthase